jgi:predicted histone-like DNA-binding protein
MEVFVSLARSSHLPSSILHLTSIIMPVFIKVSQNKITDSKSYGKWYGRVVSSKTMTYQELCKHMSEHNSVYGEDVCLGVANKLQNCMLEQLLEGKKVQFGELGVFYLSVKSSGAADEKDFNLGVNINGLYLCFAPSRTDVNNLSSKMLKKKATFMNVKDLSETKPKKPSATDPDAGSDTTDTSGDGDITGDSSNTSSSSNTPGGNDTLGGNDNTGGGGDNSGGNGGDGGDGLDQD